jgi:STE24 endopeptidase
MGKPHPMKIRPAVLAAGFTYGYAAMRLVQMLGPRPEPIAERDPKRYGAERRAYLVSGIVRSLTALATTAFVGGDALERAFAPLPRPLRVPAFVALLTAIETAREWPIDFIEGYELERRYAMSDQTVAAWTSDKLKGTAIGAVVAAALAAGADFLIHRAPKRWPLLAIGAMPPLLMLVNVVAPTFIMPLFNTYVPLEGDLERTIRELAARYDVGNAQILRFDMSRQTKKANAFVTGVFGTERIVLADTLIDEFADDETMFVVAHELGHYVRRDPWVAIGLGTIATAATILFGAAMLKRTTGHGIRGSADGARFAFYASLAGTVLQPAMAAASREIERRADRFAVAATNDPASGARAFRRLRDQNLAEDEAPKWAEFLFATHPSLKSRIARLEAATSPP